MLLAFTIFVLILKWFGVSLVMSLRPNKTKTQTLKDTIKNLNWPIIAIVNIVGPILTIAKLFKRKK